MPRPWALREIASDSQKWHRAGLDWKKRRRAACHVQNRTAKYVKSTSVQRTELRRVALRAAEFTKAAESGSDEKGRRREASRRAKKRVGKREALRAATTPLRAAFSPLPANAITSQRCKRRAKRTGVSPIRNSPARDALLRPKVQIEMSTLASIESD